LQTNQKGNYAFWNQNDACMNENLRRSITLLPIIYVIVINENYIEVVIFPRDYKIIFSQFWGFITYSFTSKLRVFNRKLITKISIMYQTLQLKVIWPFKLSLKWLGIILVVYPNPSNGHNYCYKYILGMKIHFIVSF